MAESVDASGLSPDGLKGREGSSPSSSTIRVINMFNPFSKPIKKVYGPYNSKGNTAGRDIYIVMFQGGTRTTITVARWLMIQHLRRKLLPDEHVDYINEDKHDNRLENLQVLSGIDNRKKSTLGKPSPHKGKERGWQHGTMYGWMKKKCSCEVCLTAKGTYYAAKRKT